MLQLSTPPRGADSTNMFTGKQSSSSTPPDDQFLERIKSIENTLKRIEKSFSDFKVESVSYKSSMNEKVLLLEAKLQSIAEEYPKKSFVEGNYTQLVNKILSIERLIEELLQESENMNKMNHAKLEKKLEALTMRIDQVVLDVADTKNQMGAIVNEIRISHSSVLSEIKNRTSETNQKIDNLMNSNLSPVTSMMMLYQDMYSRQKFILATGLALGSVVIPIYTGALTMDYARRIFFGKP